MCVCSGAELEFSKIPLACYTIGLPVSSREFNLRDGDKPYLISIECNLNV